MKSILHPYEMRITYMIKCTNSCCGWLASSFLHCLLESTKCENTTWILMTWSSFECCLLSRSTVLIASTKHLKCPLDHHFHVSLSSATLGLPMKGGKPLHIGRSDLSPKNHSWYSLEITRLIDPNGLNLMSNLESFFMSCFFLLV